MQKQLLATHKLILFVAFLSAAIITSLFVYRMGHQQQEQNNEHALIFPAGRDIKSFELVTGDSAKFKNKNLLGHWTLMFFGFTHCHKVCPTTLAMLAQAYKSLHKTYPDLQVVLVSLDPERDDVKTLKTYTQKFDPDFIGVSGKINELRKIQSQLGVFSEQKKDATGRDYQLQHSSSILLINPKGQWVGMFKYGMSAKEFTAAFNDGFKRLAL